MHTPALGTIFFIALATVGFFVAKAIAAIGKDWDKVRKWAAVSVGLSFAWTGLLSAVYVYGTDVLGQLVVVAVVGLCLLGWALQGGRPRGW